MLLFKSLWQAWCEIEDADCRIPIPVHAKPQSLRLDGDFLYLDFPTCPEASAVRQGLKFQQGEAFTGCFQCLLTSESGTLEPLSRSNSYSIDDTDLKEASFSAYYLPSKDSQDAVTVAIVPEVTANHQIQIRAGGRLRASHDLIGKTLKVQVTYPKTIVMTDEPIQSIYLHLVGEWEDNTIQYVGVTNCVPDLTGGLLRLKLGTVDRKAVMQEAG